MLVRSQMRWVCGVCVALAVGCQEQKPALASLDPAAPGKATSELATGGALKAGKPAPKPPAIKPPAAKLKVKELDRASVEELVKLYEAASAALADDALAPKQAAALTDGAKNHGARALKKAAETLAQSKDIAAARIAFGDVSRVLLAHLAQLPGYKKTLHVFECPMAKGFRQWVQSEEEMMNPYMGKKMLKCGFEKKH